MRLSMPQWDHAIEIDDALWKETGMEGFIPCSPHYLPDEGCEFALFKR